MKEYRVYVLGSELAKDILGFDMSGYAIENWVLYQEQHNKLLPEAEEFITACEEQGDVYSIGTFQTTLNIEDLDSTYYYIFITNCY